MKILLFGRSGQLGWEANRTLAPLGEVHAFNSSELDLTQYDKLRDVIRQIKPHVIVNTSAYTDVDRAESEPELAMAVNAKAPGIMAEEARLLNAVLIHYSTDYVFDGTKGTAYIETDATNPLNVYGQSKLAGEQAISQVGGAHVILRTSWVYSARGNGFVKKVLGWSRKQKILKMVTDQVGSPTWARMLAGVTSEMIACSLADPLAYFSERNGTYHLSGSGSVTRFDFAQMILSLDPQRQEQITQRLEPALTVDFPTPAQRPLMTPLDCLHFERVFGLRIPEWEESLRMAMAE
jgi:dTDP-4-dehydrorhamnose reductase